MSDSHFNQPKKDWSARKHAVLRDYFPTFCKALSRQGTIWYVDGFAGAGSFRDPNNPNSSVEAGSPVLAAEIAQQLSYDVRCYNVEEDQGNYQSLVEATKQYPHVINIHADFNTVVGQILTVVQSHPAFFFLDPFGTKDLPMEGVIDRIAMRTKPTDILVRYATETVRRLAGAYEKDLPRRDAHARNLDKWFRGNDWRQIIQQFPVGQSRDTELLTYYLRQLVSISGGRLRFAAAYPIRTIDGYIKYHLVFATGDQLGVKLMSDVLYKTESLFIEEQTAHEQQKQEHLLAGQMILFGEEAPSQAELYKQHLQNIQNSILEIARTSRTTWNFDDLRLELIINRNWFARMSEKDFRAAVKALYTKGKIERLSPGRAWNKDTLLRITYDS